MNNKNLIKQLDDLLVLLAKHDLVTNSHLKLVSDIEKVFDSEQAAWDMLDELKSSQDFGGAFGEVMKELAEELMKEPIGSGEVGEA